MKLVGKITDQIQTNHVSNLNVRANYLYDLYRLASTKLLNTNDYLDLGCGYGVNSEVFGKEFGNIYCSDLGNANLVKCKEYMSRSENVFYVAADARYLPFEDEHFDLVSAISLIEHVPDQEQMLREALRVLKKGGELVMQFPNRHFFMELHSGIPFYCLVPGFAKPWVSKKMGYSGLSGINIPSPKKVKMMIRGIDPSVRVKIVKVVYPVEVVPPRFRGVYSILKRMGVFRVVPFGWLLLCEK
ncbi:MAG: class I SAM-dependent methyltransferase [Methanosarcinaceae archaeon]